MAPSHEDVAPAQEMPMFAEAPATFEAPPAFEEAVVFEAPACAGASASRSPQRNTELRNLG